MMMIIVIIMMVGEMIIIKIIKLVVHRLAVIAYYQQLHYIAFILFSGIRDQGPMVEICCENKYDKSFEKRSGKINFILHK